MGIVGENIYESFAPVACGQSGFFITFCFNFSSSTVSIIQIDICASLTALAVFLTKLNGYQHTDSHFNSNSTIRLHRILRNVFPKDLLPQKNLPFTNIFADLSH